MGKQNRIRMLAGHPDSCHIGVGGRWKGRGMQEVEIRSSHVCLGWGEDMVFRALQEELEPRVCSS